MLFEVPEEPEREHKPYYILGRDVTKIPCFRKSLLYGFAGGFGGGLTYFLFTSKPMTSCHVAFGAYWLTTMTIWVQCRYQYSKTKFELAQLKEAAQRRAMHEGTKNFPAESEPKTEDSKIST